MLVTEQLVGVRGRKAVFPAGRCESGPALAVTGYAKERLKQ